MIDSPELGYQPSLNGLRAVAVSLVMAEHAMAFLAPSLAGKILPGGFIGVDIFFVLSGFLITTLLLEEHRDSGGIDVGHFYARRALRLFPALAVMTAAALLIARLADHDSLRSLARSAVLIGCYAVNWSSTFSSDVTIGLGHTWSLAVEEQFYLLWPAVVLLAMRMHWSPRTWQCVLTSGIVASALLKAYLWHGSHDWAHIYLRTDARADSLLIGALLALWRFHGGDLRPMRRMLPVALTVLAAAALTTSVARWWLYYGGFTIVAAAAAVLIACILADSPATNEPLRRALTVRPLVHLGRISYGLYLWHVPLFLFIEYHVSGSALLKVPLGLAATLAAAELSMKLVEQPFLNVKRRLARRRRAGDREQLQPVRP